MPSSFCVTVVAPVLLHGVACSGRIWQDVVPLVSAHHDVHALTLLGHHGGPAIQRHPPQVSDVVDAAERDLDDLGIDRPHLAGNSLGGWIAIELARRGRAASVCAFSPAGFWWDRASHRRPANAIRVSRAITSLASGRAFRGELRNGPAAEPAVGCTSRRPADRRAGPRHDRRFSRLSLHGRVQTGRVGTSSGPAALPGDPGMGTVRSPHPGGDLWFYSA